MLTVSLTSIPPRFPGIGATLASLRAQDGVGHIVLTLPRTYREFPGPFTPPPLPDGVELRWTDTDLGPATKLLPFADVAPPDQPILICDDDWAYGSGWAAGFAAAHAAAPAAALAASSFDSRRIGTPGVGTIVQGFAGVLVTRAMLPPETWDMPGCCQAVDDIWLSGMLALSTTRIRTLPALRALCTPSGNESTALQSRTLRADLNSACASWLGTRHGLWG